MEIVISVLIGIALGVGATLGFIFGEHVVMSKKDWKERELLTSAIISRLDKLVAENAKLRVALATGVMAEDAKKIAAVTMAALDAVIKAKVVMQECTAFDSDECIAKKIEAAKAKRSLSEMLADGGMPSSERFKQ